MDGEDGFGVVTALISRTVHWSKVYDGRWVVIAVRVRGISKRCEFFHRVAWYEEVPRWWVVKNTAIFGVGFSLDNVRIHEIDKGLLYISGLGGMLRSIIFDYPLVIMQA